MKILVFLLLSLLSNFVFSQKQSDQSKMRAIKPKIQLDIIDFENCYKEIVVERISYDEIPKNIDFRGTVVESTKWSDILGENILIQTVSGQFKWKDYLDGSNEYDLQDKSELHAYLFRKERNSKTFKPVWKIYDYMECYGVDWFTGFIPHATTITDQDRDGVSEISIPYVLICRGDVSPGVMKIIMYENKDKYALRGTTMTFCSDQNKTDGIFKPSNNLPKDSVFYAFLENRWEEHKCENQRFY